MRKFLLFVILGTTGTLLQAQRLPRHSLAVGLENSVATVTYDELSTAAVSLHLNHQRNFASFFSLRTNLKIAYFLPVHAEAYYSYDPDQFYSLMHRTNEFTHAQVALTLMPCFYYRDEYFNLFMGVAGGFGSYTIIRYRYDDILNYPTPGAEYVEKGYRDETGFQFGFSPAVGIGFKLSGEREGGEIGIEFSYDKWQYTIPFSYRTGYTAYGMQIFYRYNFMK